MANGVICLFSGAQPETADDAETGDLLMTLTLNAGEFNPSSPTNGLNMGASTDGVLSKDETETWQGVGLAAAGVGTEAGWFRWYDNDMITGESTVAVRVDGAIGASNEFEMQLSNVIIVENGPSTVNTFSYTTIKQA